jgi:hypothetical protein
MLNFRILMRVALLARRLSVRCGACVAEVPYSASSEPQAKNCGSDQIDEEAASILDGDCSLGGVADFLVIELNESYEGSPETHQSERGDQSLETSEEVPQESHVPLLR